MWQDKFRSREYGALVHYLAGSRHKYGAYESLHGIDVRHLRVLRPTQPLASDAAQQSAGGSALSLRNYSALLTAVGTYLIWTVSSRTWNPSLVSLVRMRRDSSQPTRQIPETVCGT
jgi:hypothetical protein